MAVKTVHKLITLRCDELTQGIHVSKNTVLFQPKWGGVGMKRPVLAAVLLTEGAVYSGVLRNPAIIAVSAENMPVIVPVEARLKPEREFILVQNYDTGVGAKRWPDFELRSVEDVAEVQMIGKSECTGGGSGGEYWYFVSAPLGFADAVVRMCDNRRDASDNLLKTSEVLAFMV